MTRARPFLGAALLLAAVLVGPNRAADGSSAPAPPSWARRLADRLDRALTTRCLTPDSGRALQDAVASGALRVALGDDFTLASGDIQPQHVDLTLRGRDGGAHSVRLALAGTQGGRADGMGAVFQFYLLSPAPAPDDPVRQALLRAARALDAAVPASTLERCSGAGTPHAERRYPRAFALAGAAVQVLILVIAIGVGLASLSPHRDEP